MLLSKMLNVFESFETKVDKLTNFQLDPNFRSETFSNFITFLCCKFEDFELDYTFANEYTEKQLNNFVRNAMLQIQKYL